MNPFIDTLVGVAISAPIYVIIFLCAWFIFINKENTSQNINIVNSTLAIFKALLIFSVGGFIAYIPYYFSFDFYYWGLICPARGSVNDCKYGYDFKIFTIFGMMVGVFIFIPIYLFIWFIIDILIQFLIVVWSFILYYLISSKRTVKYKKYKGKEYKRFNSFLEKNDK